MSIKKYHYIFLGTVGIMLLSFGLNSYISPLFDLWVKINTNDFQSKIVAQSLENIDIIKIPNSKNIQSAYFYDENIGYGYINTNFTTVLYKTLDGGKMWSKLGEHKGLYGNNIIFISTNTGFITGTKVGENSSEENISVVSKTTDGGETWKTVYSANKTNFLKIIFNNQNTGIIVGKKIISENIDTANFILLTDDYGTNWIDVSESLNKLVVKPTGKTESSLTDVYVSKNQSIFVLSSRGKIYKSSDNGISWSLVTKLVGEPPQTEILGFSEVDYGKISLFGGTISFEGEWGMIAVINNHWGWDRYRLNGYYFSNVVYFPENEVIAVGAIASSDYIGGEKKLNRGVILYSSNCGKEWSVIYESNVSKQFNLINKVSENKVFIIGDKGEIVLLRTKNFHF